jgi:hypothetical protein
MSSKTAFSAIVAVVIGATVMIAGPSFAASTPTPAPARSTAAARQPAATPAPAPAESRRATQAKPVRSRPNFTG